jgi:hypothetical protein
VRGPLAGVALARAQAQLLQLRREPVARALELAQVEQHRAAAAGGLGAGHRPHVGEASGDERRQLALEPCDLPAQGAPGGALAVLDDGDPAVREIAVGLATGPVGRR